MPAPIPGRITAIDEIVMASILERSPNSPNLAKVKITGPASISTNPMIAALLFCLMLIDTVADMDVLLFSI
jgi:hypothetical protein